MKTALFVNFTSEEFIGYWDGKSKKFKPGESLYMQDYLARHWAKHLTNRELLKTDANGNLIYKDGEKMTSPKKPEDVPLFMELFNKAYIPEKEEEEFIGSKEDTLDSLIDLANKNRGVESKKPQDPTQPQIIDVPDDDEDEKDAFPNKPQ